MSNSSQKSHRLLSRLYKDLNELQNNPYPGVAVFTDDADLRKLCLVLTPPSGPWKDMSLHFDVCLPEGWPNYPPQVKDSVRGIDHPNLFGSFICCDLLKLAYITKNGYTGGYTPALTLRGLFLQFLTFFSSTQVEQEYGDTLVIGDQHLVHYVWGRDIKLCRFSYDLPLYASSASRQEILSTLWDNSSSPKEPLEIEAGIHEKRFIHVEKHFLHRLEYPNPRRATTLELISKWSCASCPYGSVELPHLRPSSTPSATTATPFQNSMLLRPPTVCMIDNLNDDMLLELADHLSSETVITLSHAYPRFDDLASRYHICQRLELNCFLLRLPLQDVILGIGVALDTGSRMLSSDFDWLSMEAYDVHDIRTSIEKRNFQYFLPLAFNRAHFVKAHDEIWERLSSIDFGLCMAEEQIVIKTGKASNRRTRLPQKPHHTIDVLYRMMNNIIVLLMKSCDDVMGRGAQGRTLLNASEKAIISYCHIFHLIIQLCGTTPQIVHDINTKLRLFMTQDAARSKAQTPDIGEFIVIIMIAHILPRMDDETQPRVTWDMISGRFLQEVITRNVRWVLKDAPELELFEQGASDYRLNKTFQLSKTSLRLIMFQMTFLRLFTNAYASDLSRLESNYGFPEKELPEHMVTEIKEIYKVDSWPKFFTIVRWSKGVTLSKEAFSRMLRDCVKASATCKYHQATHDIRRLGRLRGIRKNEDKLFQPEK